MGALAVGLLSFLLYLRTLSPSLPTGDSGELISAAWVLGVAHPPGYPLFTILTHLFELLPFGSPAYGANLMSATLDAITVGVVFLLIHRLVAGASQPDAKPVARWVSLVAATVGSLLLAVSTTFWAYSVVAEVFPLNNLFAALLLLVMVEWHRRPERTGLLWLFALLSGLAATNQQTIVLLAPGFLVLLASGLRRLRKAQPDRVIGLRLRDLAIALGLLLIGLLPYGYLPLTALGNPALNWQDPDTLERFLSVVLRSTYGTFRLTSEDQSGSILEHLGLFGSHLLEAYNPIGVILAVVGILWLTRRDRVEAAALVAVFLVAGPGFLAYANVYLASPLTRGIVERFYILPGIPLGALIGCGAAAAMDGVRTASFRGSSIRNPALAGVAALFLLVPLVSGALHFGTADHSDDRVAIEYAEDILGTLEPNALLLTHEDHNYTAITYAQVVEGTRPDVVSLEVELLKTAPYVMDQRRRHPAIEIPWAVYDDGEKSSLADLVQANINQRPVYFVGKMKEELWTDEFDKEHLGLVTRLVPKGLAPDPDGELRRESARFAALHYPEKAYPETSWEAVIAKVYAKAAFDLAFALQGEGSVADDLLAERMYRTSIRLNPDRAVAYKNLGLLLVDRGGDLREVVDLWEHYLATDPDDPQVGALRGRLETIRAGLP